MEDIELPQNLLEYWVFDLEGKTVHSKVEKEK